MDLSKISWFPFSDEPLILPSFFTLRMSSPCLILPKEAVDGKWHLFCNSIYGIHHYTSDSGISWQHIALFTLGAFDPFIFYENGLYYLFYAKVLRNNPFSKKGARLVKSDVSRIEVIYSRDLIYWSSPLLVLDSRSVPFSSVGIKKPYISNPQLIKEDGYYRLYFGASYVKMPDYKIKFPRFIGTAVSEKIRTGFKNESENPILEPEPDSKYSNLALGKVNIFKHDLSYYAFNCSAYWDSENGSSFSSINIKTSTDGLVFSSLSERPILVPSVKGWTSKYIRSCNVSYINYEKCYYCYYSALSRKKISKEPIGLFLGVPVQRTERGEV